MGCRILFLNASGVEGKGTDLSHSFEANKTDNRGMLSLRLDIDRGWFYQCVLYIYAACTSQSVDNYVKNQDKVWV